MTRGKHGYKYQKLCHNPSTLPREREGSLAAKSPNLSAKGVVRLNRTHSFLNLQAKFSNYKISSELSKIRSIRQHSPQITQNSHQLLTRLHCVSGTCPGRELSEIPVNYTNSAQFAHNIRELREIRTIC